MLPFRQTGAALKCAPFDDLMMSRLGCTWPCCVVCPAARVCKVVHQYLPCAVRLYVHVQKCLPCVVRRKHVCAAKRRNTSPVLPAVNKNKKPNVLEVRERSDIARHAFARDANRNKVGKTVSKQCVRLGGFCCFSSRCGGGKQGVGSTEMQYSGTVPWGSSAGAEERGEECGGEGSNRTEQCAQVSADRRITVCLICGYKSKHEGLISEDRSNKATLLLTTPHEF